MVVTEKSYFVLKCFKNDLSQMNNKKFKFFEFAKNFYSVLKYNFPALKYFFPKSKTLFLSRYMPFLSSACFSYWTQKLEISKIAG